MTIEVPRNCQMASGMCRRPVGDKSTSCMTLMVTSAAPPVSPAVAVCLLGALPAKVRLAWTCCSNKLLASHPASCCRQSVSQPVLQHMTSWPGSYPNGYCFTLPQPGVGQTSCAARCLATSWSFEDLGPVPVAEGATAPAGRPVKAAG